MRKILIFTSSNYLFPSSRIRGYFVAEYLSKKGFEVAVYPYEDVKSSYLRKILRLSKDFLKKVKAVMQSDKRSIVYVQRGICRSPIVSAFFIFLSKYVFQRKVVYDLTDAVFLTNPFEINNIFKWSDLVVVGGRALLDYVRRINPRTILIPPSPDLSRYIVRHDREKHDEVVLGYVGSPTTTYYLNVLLKPLEHLAKSYDFKLRILSAPSEEAYKSFDILFSKFRNSGVKLETVPWKFENEPYELTKIDIGLAPLFKSAWETYKGNFKVINYMAAGIPPVASSIGENNYIIHDSYNGFLCENEQEWFEKLKKLTEDKELRENMGINARKTAEEKYSLEKNYEILSKILKSIY